MAFLNSRCSPGHHQASKCRPAMDFMEEAPAHHQAAMCRQAMDFIFKEEAMDSPEDEAMDKELLDRLIFGDIESLNGLTYCEHGREICRDCRMDCVMPNDVGATFAIPRSGPQFPSAIKDIKDKHLEKHLGMRWLAMQENAHGRKSAPSIRLPQVKVPEEVRSSPAAMQETLITLFQDIKGEASSQRYYYANQGKIMLQDYDIFVEGAVLYKEQASSVLLRSMHLRDFQGFPSDPSLPVRMLSVERRSITNIVNAFGFFLELNTQKTFWLAIERTFDSLISHVKCFDDGKDHGAAMTKAAKDGYLQGVAHFYWAVQHAQFRLDKLWSIQSEVFQHDTFPFFPYAPEALEANADVHLVIAKLSKTPVHDLTLFATLFEDLKRASDFPAQMAGVNAQLMAAIDELSAKFRVFEKILMGALLTFPEKDIKRAMEMYKFNPQGIQVNAREDDATYVQSQLHTIVHNRVNRDPDPKKLSFLHNLIKKENVFRKANLAKIARPPFSITDLDVLSKGMFKAFKTNFTYLYRKAIREDWKGDGHSLLGPDAIQRFQHRQEVRKERWRSKPSVKEDEEAAELAEIRSVPERDCVDPALFWEIGDGSLERYVPPVIREKIKTRKSKSGIEGEGEHSNGDTEVNEGTSEISRLSGLAIEEKEDPPPTVQRRSFDELKRNDLETRDLLWRKVKGTLKWTKVVQLLSRLGCKILNLDGSKRKFVDMATGRCTVLHRPHPSDECRPDQRESYRMHIEDWLQIKYSDVVLSSEAESEDSSPPSWPTSAESC